jgi:hypothetical protein
MKRRYWFAGAVAILGLLALWPVLSHYRAKGRLERYKKELRVRGEKLSPAELAPALVSARCENGRLFVNAAARLPRLPDQCLPSFMKIVGPGRARVAWKQEKLAGGKGTNIWPQLREEMGKMRDSLAEIRETLEGPEFQFDLDYARGDKLLLPHLVRVKGPAQTLGAAMIVDLHNGNPAEAWANLRAVALLVGHFRDEPLLISQLVRFAVVSVGMSITWEALQFPGWSAEQLAELQAAWDSFDLLDGLEPAMAMEPAMGETSFQELRESRGLFADNISAQSSFVSGNLFDDLAEAGQKLAEDPGGIVEALHDRFTRYWAWRWWYSYDEELANMRQWRAGMGAALRMKSTRCFLPARRQLEDTLASLGKLDGRAARSFVFVTPDGDMVKKFLAKAARTETHRRLVVTVLALERYRLAHGTYPPTLSSLTPELLRETPHDFMDGQPLRYRLKDDGTFLLYSIGEDGKDGGGDPTPATSGNKPTFWNGRDWVWPTAAKPEEVAEAEKERK